MSAGDRAAPASRRARILQRTVVGSVLAGAVVALLIAASASEQGWIVLGAGLVLSALSCLELARMGSLAGRGWPWVLAPCWLLALGLGQASLEMAQELRSADVFERMSAHGYVPALPLEIVCVALLAILARAAVDAWSTRRAAAAVVAGVLVAWAGTWSLLFFSPTHPLATICLDDSDLGLQGYAVVLLPGALLAWYAELVWARERMPDLLRAAWIAPLLVLPLPWMWHVWERCDHVGLIALILLAKVGDVAGYFVGNAIGKRHPFPRISPGKTVAGCWASLLAGMAVGGVLVTAGLLPQGRLGIAGGVLAGGVTNVAAQAGDLLESWIKRRAGVKDSGRWFGPSGGVLDLVDSLLLAVPAALLAWPWLLA